MLAVAVCFVTLAVAFDLKTDRIPNALNLTGLTAGLFMTFMRAGPTGLLPCIRGIALMFAATFLLYRLRAMRGGDGKMLCALSAVFGEIGGFRILLWSLVSASVIGLPQIMKKKKGDRTKIHCSLPIAFGVMLYLANYGGEL